MSSPSKKIEIGIVLATAAVIIAVWAVNGYEDTWLYATALIIAVPASWFLFGKNKN